MATKIDWTDSVWNPVWGCTYSCPFCYARKFAKRFAGQVARWNGLSRKETERFREFKPVWLPKNFSRPLRGRIIFVNSMSDIADWKEGWVEKVLKRIEEERERVFLILTKRPKRALKVLKRRELPPNLWLGVSATKPKELEERVRELTKADTPNLFVSFEPFLAPWKTPREKGIKRLKWVIFGAKTNPLKLPRRVDLIRATEFFEELGIPVWHKDNLQGVGIELKRERPF
jgi:protein gp37